jgi:hypothetical protein
MYGRGVKLPRCPAAVKGTKARSPKGDKSHWETLFRTGNEDFLVQATRSRNCAEAYTKYAAQAMSQIDTARTGKDRFQPKNPGKAGE